MKIVFLSNFYNHHQAFISRKLYELTDGNYRFIATASMPEERKKLGYREYVESFVLQYEEGAENSEDIFGWIDSADFLIFGSAPEKLLKNRKKNKKYIFRYSEHPLKKKSPVWKYPLRWFKWHLDNPLFAPIYMLCASAYTAEEYAKYGLYKNKTFKWGYFPEAVKYSDCHKLIKDKTDNEILWCGRFLDWKHPDDALKVALDLKNSGYTFHMSIIGTGELEEELYAFTEENGLCSYVTFCGSVSPERVREYMEKASVYLMTSDHKEGWGAVVNEAMNSGCAVVASARAGSVPYLLKNGENGYVYNTGDVSELINKVKSLLDDKTKCESFGLNAYSTVINTWNADSAAERLVSLFEEILKGNSHPDLFADGPCSRA